MKTYKLAHNTIEPIEVNEEKFQVWHNGAILQIQNGKSYWISNPDSFRWATHFHNLNEAIRNAKLMIEQNNWKGGIKIFSGNILHAKFSNNQWKILETPIKQLL